MFALVDCNSFFCSVEKVFHPGLNGRPVCVLSNNDGCIVALTPEAKTLGLHSGDPLFKVKDIVKANNVRIFSTNMQLYAAMSKRVTNILRKSVAHVENYSIDENFCYLDGYERIYNLEDFMRDIADRIKLWTDIPVSVGVAPSKTLAKMGSKFAKKYKGYRSVCMIDNEEKRRKALSMFELGDIWGIGRQTLAKLNYYGISTPLELAVFVSLVSGLTARPVQTHMCVLGSMSIGGTIIPTSDLTGALQIAADAGAKRMLIPVADMMQYGKVPADLISKFSLEVYSDPVDAAFKALGIK